MRRFMNVRVIIVLSIMVMSLVISGFALPSYEGQTNRSIYALKSPDGKTYEVYPGDDFRAVYNNLEPGDEIVFHEGEYRISDYHPRLGYNTFLYLTNSGTPDRPIVIRGYGKGEKRPVFIYDIDIGRNLCEIRGDNQIIAYLEFQPLVGNPCASRITDSRSNITIRDCVFRNCASTSITANSGNAVYENITILNNAFIGVKYTPIYIGEHSGSSPVTGFVFENNYVDASEINNSSIVGYGMELKKNVKGAVVRNNIIMNSQGPGIMVYGADGRNPDDANIVEGNIVVGTRNSSGILVGAGPSVVKNNLIVGCLQRGIQAYDYGSRGMFNDYTITGNTLVCNNRGGMIFYLPGSYTPENITVADNLVISKEGTPAFEDLPADMGWITENNYEVFDDEELQALVNELKIQIPKDEDSLNNVWPHLNKLKKGPLNIAEVKNIISKVIQKIQ